jgi:hypothetical protein
LYIAEERTRPDIQSRRDDKNMLGRKSLEAAFDQANVRRSCEQGGRQLFPPNSSELPDLPDTSANKHVNFVGVHINFPFILLSLKN